MRGMLKDADADIKRQDEEILSLKGKIMELEERSKTETWEGELSKRLESIKVFELRRESLKKETEVESRMDAEKAAMERILNKVRRLLEEYGGGGRTNQPYPPVDPPTPSSNRKRTMGVGDEEGRANQPHLQQAESSSPLSGEEWSKVVGRKAGKGLEEVKKGEHGKDTYVRNGRKKQDENKDVKNRKELVKAGTKGNVEQDGGKDEKERGRDRWLAVAFVGKSADIDYTAYLKKAKKEVHLPDYGIGSSVSTCVRAEEFCWSTGRIRKRGEWEE